MVLYKALNMHLMASIIGCQFWELIGCLSMIFGGVPASNVDDSLDSAYLGPFKVTVNFNAISLSLTNLRKTFPTLD